MMIVVVDVAVMADWIIPSAVEDIDVDEAMI